ncbi:MAG: type IV toxin-antitoxin system AbiEi family antitoxin domain-containing protein [Pirellulales bacterium]|nr:type IV toxin-antitoxin system AbiEi family antitoxin domain-containing protein [Alphaproteobacteria bacterium]MDA8040871.1 type IV toxin-antitoxin system AbiEi family antitoxin domain-containing protein [Pirellulales bacterium]
MGLWGVLLESIGATAGTVVTTRDLYSEFPLLNKSSIRSALSRAVAAGAIQRIGRGTYQFVAKYVKVRIAKRIFDTHDPKPIRSLRGKDGKLELDVEVTAEGWIPIALDPSQADQVVRDELLYQSIYILNKNLFGFDERLTEFEIEGMQRLNETSSRYDPKWNLEIKVVNKQARHYTYNGWFNIPLKKYDQYKPSTTAKPAKKKRRRK